jgi:diguanylate cyclase (GGDEF)-like protein
MKHSWGLLGAGRRAPSARAAGALLLAGAAVAAITTLVPPEAERLEWPIAAAGALALVLGGFLFFSGRRVSERYLGLVVALATAMIGLASYSSGTAGAADNEMLYVWVCLYAFYFFSLPHALAQLALVGAAYGGQLFDHAMPDEALSSWIVTMSTLTVVGLFVARLRRAVDRLVGDLSERAHVDSLTGMLNRRGLEERGALELARARRDGKPLSALALDVDHFKLLNDGYGHAAGDAVLRHVAKALAGSIRAVDAVARLGGDEFVVILPGASCEEAKAVADRLRDAVRDRNGGRTPPVTLSIGVATGAPEADSLERLWHSADLAMYEAKRAGGNEIRISRRPAALATT